MSQKCHKTKFEQRVRQTLCTRKFSRMYSLGYSQPLIFSLYFILFKKIFYCINLYFYITFPNHSVFSMRSFKNFEVNRLRRIVQNSSDPKEELREIEANNHKLVLKILIPRFVLLRPRRGK